MIIFLSAQYFIFCVLVSFARSLTPLQKLTYQQNTPGIQFMLLQIDSLHTAMLSHIMSQHFFISWTTHSSRTSASIINDTWNKCYSDNTEQWNSKWTNYIQVRCMAEQSSLPLQQHLSIHLVYSAEGSCHLPSLDSDSYRSKNEYLDQNFHRKPTHIERCQNATAHHHLAHKFHISQHNTYGKHLQGRRPTIWIGSPQNSHGDSGTLTEKSMENNIISTET